ncbi:MAG: hypothetical protein AAGJ46_09370 [Planctomycetota bacterium]
MAGLAIATTGLAARAAAPVAASVMLFDDVHTARGPEVVDRAARVGAGRVQVVVNLHVRLSPKLEVLQYGVLRDRRRAWDEGQNYRPLTPHLLAEFQAGLEATLRRAADRRLDVAILPHLDAVGPNADWRNDFRFDPLHSIGGYSYRSAMIEPIARALQATQRPDGRIWFSLAGEMGRSVAEFSGAYRAMLEGLSADPARAGWRIGVSLNFSEFTGGANLSPAQRRGYQELLDRCGFVGVSCYRPFTPPATPALFRKTVDQWLGEIAAAGLIVPSDVPLHLSEVGLGGGPPSSKRYTPAAAAATPWLGVSHQLSDPWRSAEMKAFRRGYYRSLLGFLTADPLAARTEAVFLWSEGSWAPLAVDQSRFADAEVARAVLRHNRQAAGAGGGR